MPPVKKFQREDIVLAAYNIVKREGIKGVNARRIAKELGCSVQPIFHNFASMEILYQEVYKKMYQKYQEYLMSGISKEHPYKQMGLAYIRFAKDYPEFFKLIFMQKTNLNAETFVISDAIGKDVIGVGRTLTGLSYEDQKKFHVKVWIFTHGIACLVATNTVKFTEEEIEKLLTDTVREMLHGHLNQ